jgi:succinoglycan biosynthesis transport protein ExoP
MNGEFQLAAREMHARAPTARDLAVVFFRHQRLFAVTFILVLSAGLLYSLLSASYTSQMKLVVRRGRIDPAVSPTQTIPPQQNAMITEEELNSAVELFRDEDVLRAVVADSGLADRRSWISWLRKGTVQQREERAARQLSQELEIRPVRKSQVITISYHSRDPKLSATVLRSLANVYLTRQAHVQRPPGQTAFFNEQVQIADGELRRVQHEYELFMREKRVVSAALERDLMLQKLSDAQANEFAVQSSLAEVQGKARSLDQKLQELPPRRVIQVRNSDNAQLQEKLKSKLLDLELRRIQLLTKFQSSYRLVQEIDQQIAQTKMTLEAENLMPVRDELTEDNPDYVWANSERLKAAIELRALASREAVARQQLATYQDRAQEAARSAPEQRALEQQLKAVEDKYLLYLGKREEARIGDALDQTGILNVAVAQPPHVPALPSTSLGLAAFVSLFAAGILSTGAVFVADYVDPSLRTPEEVVALLRTPVLASFPVPPDQPKLRAL